MIDGQKLKDAFYEQERLERSGSLRWFHWAIILASFVLTFGAWSLAKTQHKMQIKERFDREAQQIVELLEDRLQQYEGFLESGAAAIESRHVLQSDSDKVHADHLSWRAYSQALNLDGKYPGVNGIGFIDRLPRSKLAAYLATQRQIRPDFKIHPAHQEEELFPIVFIEPVETNAAAIGLDMAHETNRYTAAKAARDTGLPQITGPIILVQDSEQTPGFLLFSPTYKDTSAENVDARREAFTGLVYAPFIFKSLMQGTLGKEKRQVGLHILDGPTTLFNENMAGVEGFDPDPVFKTQKMLSIYGRNWTFDIWSRQSFNAASSSGKPRLILIGGLAIDALLIAFFSLLAQANRRAIKFANQMADAQKADAARLKSIIDNTVEGMMFLNSRREIQSFNKACEVIFGYSAKEVIGKNAMMLFPQVVGRYDLQLREEGELRDVGVPGQTKDGRDIPLEFSASLISIEGERFYNLTVRDITLRKRADKKLKQVVDELITSNEELEKFAYIASHDLKSPLRGIDNLSKWIEEDLDDVLDDENRRRIATLRRRVTRMDSLLNDLLEYSRAGYNDRTAIPVEAGQLLREVWELLHVPPAFELHIDEALESMVVARMPLEQIFHNLINNAVKHHDKNSGKISVSVSEMGDLYAFSVTDDGPGIALEFQEKIFEMFQTLRPRDEVEGSGMGLALVRKIIYCYGGTIGVESETGRGSSFVFSLPKVLRERVRPDFNALTANGA